MTHLMLAVRASPILEVQSLITRKMSKKTVIQECIERSSRLDFMHWFYANKDRLLKEEKEQLVEAYYAGTAQFDNAAPIINPKTPHDYYKETYGGVS